MLNIRLKLSVETVEKLEDTLRQAYRAGDAKLVQRVTALIRLSRREAASAIGAELGCSVGSIYAWLKSLVYEGLTGLKVKWRGGRKSKLSKTQKARLCALIKAGSLAAGYTSACWNAAMLQALSRA